MANLNNTIGAIFLGNLVAAILYGITCLQTFIYWKDYHRDRPSFRLLIASLWVLDTLHMVSMTHGSYQYLVVNFSNPTAMADPTWSLLLLVGFTALSDLIVRLVFVRRLWLLSGRKRVLSLTVIITTIFTFGAGLAFSIRGFIDRTFARLLSESWMVYSSLGAGVLADGLIAISLCVLLLKHHRAGFKSMDSVVHSLVMYSINTGLITSICATTCFVTFAVWPHKFIFMGIYFVLSKLHINSLLAVLNTRAALLERSSGISTIPVSPSSIEPLSVFISHHVDQV